MATLRQLTEDFYVKRKDVPPGKKLISLFEGLLRDLERRLTLKLFDQNRTLTSLVSEVRRTADIDGVHVQIFEAAFPDLPLKRGKTSACLQTLSEVGRYIPLQMFHSYRTTRGITRRRTHNL